MSTGEVPTDDLATWAMRTIAKKFLAEIQMRNRLRLLIATKPTTHVKRYRPARLCK